MPEMKNSFQRGRMNKDLDERMVPQGEYRDALNVEVNTSEGSNIGTLQSIMGNTFLLGQTWSSSGQTCIGSVANDRTNKVYFMICGDQRDFIIEYDQDATSFAPVCVDAHFGSTNRALGFVRQFIITGINVIDDIIFWTDNNSEPKRINITRGKQGSQVGGTADYTTTTRVVINDPADPTVLVDVLDEFGSVIPISEKHLTVIKPSPPGAPVLEMVDTEKVDNDGDGDVGGYEVTRSMTLDPLNPSWLDVKGEFFPTYIISVGTDIDGDGTGADFFAGDYLEVYAVDDPSVKVRLLILSGGYVGYTCEYMAGDKDIRDFTEYMVRLVQPSAFFEFKLPRFGYRYKYVDGEYSTFSPFTEPAFLPGSYNYMSKEGYNLGMVNRVRKLAIKDFVHTRKLPEDVVSIDILYKESNSPNIYSVKTIKNRAYNPLRWDEWNAISKNKVISGPTATPNNTGWKNKTKGYLPITSEMIHAVLPSNQLLRPWDNVPRKALAQEVVGNRLVYGNYLQNYDLENLDIFPQESNIKVNIQAKIKSWELGDTSPEEIRAPEGGFMGNYKGYSTGKSLKTLRTYQLGVIYIDKYGRETPVFSEDKIGVSNTAPASVFNASSTASVFNDKENCALRNNLTGTLKNNPPGWATHYKYFIKETSNEYYNLAMDRWYDAEDGNIWLSFPSAERNKVDEETFIILKKQHDNSKAVTERARYKILAISNEAPRFIKLQNNAIGQITDDGSIFGHAGSGFPLVGEVAITVDAVVFEAALLQKTLMEQGVKNCFLRMSTDVGISNYYAIRSVSKDSGYYRIKVKEEFKNDMAITSADNTMATRVLTSQLTIVRREAVDKAEFDGRFFAKILKDAAIISQLGVNLTPEVKLKTLVAKKVQYISPEDSQVGASGDFYGQDKYRLSVDHKKYWSSSSSTGGDGAGGGNRGDGPFFWKMAGDVSTEVTSDSSGWFIDKVEAFRPGKNKNLPNTYPFNKSNRKNQNFRWQPSEGQFQLWPYFYGANFSMGYFSNLPHKLLNVHNINAYNFGAGANDNVSAGAGDPYLGLGDLRTGNEMNSGSNAEGRGIAKPIGIDAASNTINISYSGVNDNGSTPLGEYSSTTLSGLDNHYFKETGSANQEQHVDDVVFITKLTSPGTLWSWKEDPGQIVYRTVAPTGLTATSTPYNQSQWDNEQKDLHIDNEKGILLYNYAVFADYLINTHHEYTITYNCFGPQSPMAEKIDWVSRDYGDHEDECSACFKISLPFGGWTWSPTCCTCSAPILTYMIADGEFPPKDHPSYPGARKHDNDWFGNPGFPSDHGSHGRFPQGAYDWDGQNNKRRRFVFQAVTSNAQGQVADQPLGSVGPHYYLPTNDHTLPSHHNASAQPITTNPLTGVDFDTLGSSGYAPGIRPDGMYTGFSDPDGSYSWEGPTGLFTSDKIPQYKRWGTNNIDNLDRVPGSVTWQILEPFIEDAEGAAQFSSTNPAIWETEPKEDVGLDIYHEVGQIYPIHLNDETIEQFVGAIGEVVSKNSYVQCWDPPYVSVPGAVGTGAAVTLKTVTAGVSNNDIRVSAAYDRFVQLSSSDGVVLDTAAAGHVPPLLGSYLIFHRADGGTTEAHVASSWNELGVGDWYELSGNIINGDVGVHNKMVTLPWFNCYSFGNGVESDRIRDDFNQVTIDNGPKVSTTIEGQYREDRRENGFIWSGIYNSTSGVNNLNQFIQAEAITKDINPGYGSIQKMSVRDSDLVAFCEDRVLKVLADKDALFNADGNTNLVATNRVLGSIKPFIGDYGISKNPESFAKDSYRSYFSDASRGVIVRLSRDGLTPISDAGMKDWFSDNLYSYQNSNKKIIGSFDDKKQEYNLTLAPQWDKTQTLPSDSITLSYSEPSKGWVSFKSFLHENGVSINNNYFTFSNGMIAQHHINSVRNNFYNLQFDSSVDTLFNQLPSTIKSFSTLNYEGSQSRVTQDTINNPDYYDNIVKSGWYIESLISNTQELGALEFWDKEDKWFSQIKGVTTEWLNDGTAGNIDPKEFSYQGIGNATQVSCPNCPPLNVTWNCDPGTPDIPYSAAIAPVAGIPYQAATPGSPQINYQAPVPAVAAIPYSPEILYQAAVPGTPFVAGQPEILAQPEIPFQAEILAVTGVTGNPAWTKNACLDASANLTINGVEESGQNMNLPGFNMPWTDSAGNLKYTRSSLASAKPLVAIQSYVQGSVWVSGGGGIAVTEYAGDYYYVICNQHPLGTTGGGDGHVAGYIHDPNYINCLGTSVSTTYPATSNFGNNLNSDYGVGSPGPAYLDGGSQLVFPSAYDGWPYTPNAMDSPDIAVDNQGNKWWTPCPTQAMPAVAPVTAVSYQAAIPFQAEIFYQPFIADIPAVAAIPEILYQAEQLYVPAVPAIPEILFQAAVAPTAEILAVAAVLGQPEVLFQAGTPAACVPVAGLGGTYATEADCDAVCLIPESWECVTAYATTWPYLPSMYCNELFDGTGAFATEALCNTNCITPPIPQTWECDAAGSCNELFNGTGAFASEADCLAVCGIAPPSWDCVAGVCVDPGTGFGQYTNLATCQSLCNPIMLGPCNIQGAPLYNSLTTYDPGDVVEYAGDFYYLTASISIIGTSPTGMVFSTSYWTICLLTTIGVCDITDAEEWDSSIQDHTTPWPDGSLGYDKDDVVGNTWWNGNVGYYYAIYDVDPTSTFYPDGTPYDNTVNLPFGIMNPWVDCDGGSFPDVGGCDVSNYEIWDPTFDYQVGIFDNSPNLDGNWAVLHNGIFWTLNCLQTTESVFDYLDNYGTWGYSWIQPNPWGYGDAASGTTVVGDDGTVGDVNLPNGLGEQIQQEQMDCFDGVAGSPASQVGIEPGSPYSPWTPCIPSGGMIDNYFGCCTADADFGWSQYGSCAAWQSCMSDGLCDCDPAMCSGC